MHRLLNIAVKLLLLGLGLAVLVVAWSFYHISYVMPAESKALCESVIDEFKSDRRAFKEKYSSGLFESDQGSHLCPDGRCGLNVFRFRDDGSYLCQYISGGGIAPDRAYIQSENWSR